jgi:cytoskeletal protein CcmA (bactofilin family)
VTGTVRAREIDVHGELNEDIVCKEHLLIHSTGKVSGTLEYRELEIQRGGQFRGNLHSGYTVRSYQCQPKRRNNTCATNKGPIHRY